MKMTFAVMEKEQVKTMAKKYKHKSFNGTEAMVEFLNKEKILPNQIISVSCQGEWRTLVYTVEQKEGKKNV